MKIISFSEIRFVNAILDGTKTQTIRPLWDNKDLGYGRKFDLPKEPRFKVGEQVKLMFKQRSKYNHFCLYCNFQAKHIVGKHALESGSQGKHKQFPKHFATKTIEEIFEIKMWKGISKYPNFYFITYPDGMRKCEEENTELAKKDGFYSTHKMFSWFDTAYDLSTPKRFAVYRWTR